MVHALLAPATWERKPDVIAKVRDMIQATSPRTIIAALAGMAARPDASAHLPKLDMPTLVIVGAEDDITPPDDARDMAAAIPGARLEIVDDAGHMTALEEPDVVNWLIADFLTTL